VTVTRFAADRLALTGIMAAGVAWLWSCGVSVAGEVAAKDAAAVATLSRLSDDWDKAIVRKDESAIAGNMAEDFRMIDKYGNVEAKQAFVAGIMDPKLSIDPYTVEEFDVRIYGDTALLSGRTHMTGKYDGKSFESNYRYIDIYVRKGGTWKIVSVQITSLGSDPISGQKGPEPSGQ
jgi:ketosteroid isomerase-like protein